MNIALGIDPGSVHVGFAVVQFSDAGFAKWHSAWEEHPSEVGLQYVQDQILICEADIVAVEIPVPRASFALRQLVDTARCAQRAIDGAAFAGCDCVELSSYEWRKRLCGNSNAKDSHIRHALEEYLVVPRSNSHKRDAAGVALVAGWQKFHGRLSA